jgi:hypothetical protein
MSPILSLVIQSLIEHFHDLHKVIPTWIISAPDAEKGIQTSDVLVVGELSELVHLCARRSPRIVGCSITQFGLRYGVREYDQTCPAMPISIPLVQTTHLCVRVTFRVILRDSEGTLSAVERRCDISLPPLE